MKTLKTLFGLIIALSTFTSCQKTEADSLQEEQMIMEKPVYITEEVGLIEGLTLYYYGEEIKVVEASKQAVGTNGKVEYDMYQKEENYGTEYASIFFTLFSGNNSKFKKVEFELLMNMNTKGIQLQNITKEDEYMSEMNLIILLRGW